MGIQLGLKEADAKKTAGADTEYTRALTELTKTEIDYKAMSTEEVAAKKLSHIVIFFLRAFTKALYLLLDKECHMRTNRVFVYFYNYKTRTSCGEPTAYAALGLFGSPFTSLLPESRLFFSPSTNPS